MKSKISYFNGMIFKKDLTRLWPAWVLQLVLLEIAGVLPVFLSRNNGLYQKYHSEAEMVGNAAHGTASGLMYPVVPSFLAILAAVMVFRYLFVQRETYMMHSLPVSRICFFLSHYASGLFLTVVPVAFTYLQIFLIQESCRSGVGMMVFLSLIKFFMEAIFFYSLSVLVVMLSGNVIISVWIYGVLNALYAGVVYLFSCLADEFVYGMSLAGSYGTLGRYLTPLYYYVKAQREDDMAAFVLYMIPALVFILLAAVLYVKRPLESVGDMVAFRWCRPVFRFVFAICGGMLLSAMIILVFKTSASFEFRTYQGAFVKITGMTLVSCGICFLVGEMILRKTFFVWKKIPWIQMGVTILVLAGAMFIVQSDMIVGYVPKVGQLEYAYVATDDGSNYVITDSTQLTELEQVHHKCIDGKDKERRRNYEDSMAGLNLYYHLKNGRIISRFYNLNKNKDEEAYTAFNTFLNRKETAAQTVFGVDYQQMDVQAVAVDSYGQSMTFEIKNQKGMDQIYEAVLRDLQAGNMVPFVGNEWKEDSIAKIGDQTLGAVNIYLYASDALKKEKNYSEEYISELTSGKKLLLNNQCVNTLGVLKQYSEDFE